MVAFDSAFFIKKLKKLLNHQGKTIALHEPHFTGKEWEYVKECLDTGWVSSVGKFVDRFEHELAHFTGAKYAIATSNGTTALHIIYLLAGIKPGCEVLVPTLTFVGTVNPIAYCGAIPHFLDAEENYLGLNASLIEDYLKDICIVKSNHSINKLTNRPIQALCVVHTLGHPVDIDPLEEICRKYHLILLEDAAEALGSYYKGVHVGHRGLAGALSFNGNKVITTGGGGAILTNDESIAKQAKHITTTAKLPHAWKFEHDQLGYNYRLPNINAALGCAQLEQLPQFLAKKQLLAEHYINAFDHFNGLRIITSPSYGKSNYWLNAMLLDSTYANQRDFLLNELIQEKMMVRPLWDLQHTLPMYQNTPRMNMPIATHLLQRLIKLPSSSQLVLQSNLKSTAGIVA